MSANSQSLNTDTLTHSSLLDTPEKLLAMQTHAMAMFSRVCELNIKTSYNIIFKVGSHGERTTDNLDVELFWFTPEGEQARPNTNDMFCYSFQSIETIDHWFLTANVALDLLEREAKVVENSDTLNEQELTRIAREQNNTLLNAIEGRLD
ncbi:hypothetical protein [Vibrio bivalvicida]|uniref:Uncharacterized protein n=1 Tax=Vibrio bivalvicida TaxID=1276888 RepID=A0A177XW22_9VIBR|nr:hypothetical protein [Vibrio bivalvicida]OAJ92811.1 hypothetical protein APB76_18045 [Vibrio bivalvicida]